MCKVAAIIVSYNPDSNLFDSINLLLNQVEKVIIVDNGSKEKYVKYIKSINEDKIEIILNKENLGIATALNIGVRKALENGYEWILTMDQDSKASPDMVKKMFNVYNSINREERKDILSIFPNFVDERIQSIEENSNMNSYEYVDADITSGNLLRKEVFEKVGFFDDSLFIDLVDTDFCMRLNEKGIVCTIATSRGRDSLLGFLESMNIAKYFSYLLAAEDTTLHKPNAELVKKTLNELSYNAQDTLVVGDMPFDILMGKNAGVYTCGVTYGVSGKNSLLEAGADWVIDDISELLEIV